MSTHVIISVDTETGGFYPEKNPLLSVGMAVYAFDTTTLTYTIVMENEWTLKPSQFPRTTIDPEALNTNKLDPETLERDGYLITDVATNIDTVLGKVKAIPCHRIYVLGQNYNFDRMFLRKYIPEQTFARLDKYPTIELMTLSQVYNAIVHPDASKSLPCMCTRLGVTNEKAHTALADANATFKCYAALQTRFKELNKLVQITRDSISKHCELNMLVANLT